ncbi:uncharacterized protein LOC129732611 [Wyeomyia smithii]|uniref:uncharacterized protein LOC129732611 n=1 Tax=Wyeomyia smithii TaxID=174621 RepID=UPI002467B6AD|nr:uncharacterized protein LOC129732611 [Wyeomyia smithii]
MDSNKSSFIGHLISEIFENTFTRKPSNLPWYIPKYFHEASQQQQQQQITSPAAHFVEPIHFPTPSNDYPKPAPEQPLRDTLLSCVIAVGSCLDVEIVLIASRNGGTVQRLRELTNRFHLIAIQWPTVKSLSRLQQRCRELGNVNVVAASECCDELDGTEKRPTFEATLEWLANSGLQWLRERQLFHAGDQILFCYRSFPEATCVNAFEILRSENLTNWLSIPGQ